jgi:hypothetical protein
MKTDGIRRPHGLVLAGTLAVTLGVTSGCASLAPDTDAASRVAEVFHRALSEGDSEAACAELAPQTLSVLESDADQPCADAILAEDIPDAGMALETQAYGQVAQVVLDGDVVFLASFGDRWRVTAAGCTPRGERPYHCAIDGG